MTWIINGRINLRGTVDIVPGQYLQWNITAPPSAVGNFTFGGPNTIPLVGDWNGDGIEGIGVYDPGTIGISGGLFSLRQTATTGVAEITVQFGSYNLTPISWYDTYSLGFSQGDNIGVIDGSTVFLNKGFQPGPAFVTTTTSKMSCPSNVGQCKYLCGNIRIHVRDESLNFISGYNFWLDGINKGEVLSGNQLFDSIDNGSHTCQIIKADGTVGPCNYCTGSTTCTPSSNSSNCSVPITIVTDSTVTWRFTILNPVPVFTVTNITGTGTITVGTHTTVTFTATVTNSGTASGTATVTFTAGSNTLATATTGTIGIGGNGNATINVDLSAWSVGNYNVCANIS